MLSPVRTLVLFVAFVLFASLWGPVGAADEGDATEDKATKVLWVYGKDGERREVNVTHMSPELREAVNTQLEAKGWKRLSVDLEMPDEPPPPPPPPPKDEKELEEETKRDIEELVRRGGKLPEGFLPHGLGPPTGGTHSPDTPDAALAGLARAAGRMVLRYLEVKDDPVRGPVYEKVLGEVATVLAGVDAGTPLDLQQMAMRLLGRFMKAMGDPKTAPVYREIVDLVSKEMVAAMAPPSPAPPRPPAARGSVTPRFVGGAHLKPVPLVDKDLAWGLRVLGVEPGSVAHEMGLRGGDVIRAVNGQPADSKAVETIRKALGKPGKLSIEVKRKDGKIEVLDIEFEADEDPEGGSGSK